jgi:hypothetical protein
LPPTTKNPTHHGYSKPKSKPGRTKTQTTISATQTIVGARLHKLVLRQKTKPLQLSGSIFFQFVQFYLFIQCYFIAEFNLPRN